jgi:hypothetical protein
MNKLKELKILLSDNTPLISSGAGASKIMEHLESSVPFCTMTLDKQ